MGLQTLNLQSNQLTHFEIPKECVGLQTLNLQSNQLTHFEIPKECVGLETLYLQSNQLTHFEIPKECVGLETLYLRSNQLTHFEIPKECVGLRWLDLENNQLTHFDIPKECVGLKTLDLRSNQLTHFEIPKECVGLKWLSLGNNQLVNGHGNILMFISDSILEKFQDGKDIIIFNEQKKYPCQTPLAKLYQAIMKKESSTGLKEVFLSLDPKDRKLILDIIENKTNSSLHSQPAVRLSGMQPLSLIQTQKAFANPDHFYLAVQQSILKKLSSLTTEQKNKVYHKIYELAGSPATEDKRWGETHVMDNIPRLADAIAICNK